MPKTTLSSLIYGLSALGGLCHALKFDTRYGLSPNLLSHNNVSVGFYASSAGDVNHDLPGKGIGAIGYWLSLGTDAAADKALDETITATTAELLAKPKEERPVYVMSLMPAMDLDGVTQDRMDHVAKLVSGLNKQGIEVWLQWAYDMNTKDAQWGQKPELYVEKWRGLASTVQSARRGTDPAFTYMMWSARVDETTDPDAVDQGWSRYWPGNGFVDIVGAVSFWYGGSNRDNSILPPEGTLLKQLTLFDSLYASARQKPLVVALTAAAYSYFPDPSVAAGTRPPSVKGLRPHPGGLSEADIKKAWLEEAFGSQMNALRTYLAAFWFESTTNEKNGEGDLTTSDFRLLTGEDEKTINMARAFFYN